MGTISNIARNIVTMFKSNELKNFANKTAEDVAESVLTCNPVAAGRVVVNTGKAIFSLPDIIFWDKMRRFLCASYCDYDWKLDASYNFFPNDDGWQKFAKRQIYLVNELDEDSKIDYFANLTRALLDRCIDLPLYYKLANILKIVIREELEYLSANISRSESVIDVYMVSLLQHGLAMKYDHARGYWMDEPYDDTYDFTSLALCLEKFAISYRDERKYSYAEFAKLDELSTFGLNQEKRVKDFLGTNAQTNTDALSEIKDSIPKPMPLEEVKKIVDEELQWGVF